MYDAVDLYNRRLGVAVGRGAYAQALQVQDRIDRCRKLAADLLGAEGMQQIVFSFNGTDSLNIALHGLLRPGDHVVTSTIEHNSVLRPLRELRSRIGLDVSYVDADRQGRIDPVAVREAIRPNTSLVALIHASNVTGAIQPIEEVGQIAHQAGALFLVDAAQTAGHLPIDLSNLPVDLLASPGHKGLLGPLGTGLLYIRPGLEERVVSFRQGGTGSDSETDRQPERLPEKYEAGNHNAPGLIGLAAALDYLTERGVDDVRAHEQRLTSRLLSGLAGKPGVAVHATLSAEDRVGVVSLNLSGFEPQVAAALLDENFGIQCRAGLHCAPGAHKCLETFDSGGTVRISSGPFTSDEEIDQAVIALEEISSAD